MEIITNMLIRWIGEDDSERQVTERVLYISPDGKEIVLIDVSAKNALPVRRFREELELAYSVADLRIIEVDIYTQLPGPNDKIPEKYRQIRDKAWSLIEPLVEELGIGIYESSVRGKKIAEICKEQHLKEQKSVEANVSEEGKADEEKPRKKAIYNYLRRYWQAGRNQNGLLPKYKKCGKKGSRKNSNKSKGKKLGRPTAASKANEVQRGILTNPHTEELFKKGIKKFYLTPDKYSLAEAYRQTIDEYFSIDTETLPNGVEVPILPPADKLPSPRQFQYWYKNYYRKPDEEKKARLGETKYNLNHRLLYNHSTSMSFGPGSLYQIDATIADVYLVSSFTRNKIIGRPIVYLIVDVFSRMIVGFSVALEGPSWLGMMLALDNMVADKVAFCDDYDIKIQKWQWNCNSLPEAIIGDRGELESHAATVVADYLGVRIHNTAPYRGDLKGIVERHFGKANVETIQFVPGHVAKREHGEKDHRLDATLTLNEFRALIITHVLRHNLSRKLTDYPADKYLVADEVPHIPINLWNWGIENRSGFLHTKPRDFVRLGLLPRKAVTVTTDRKGIHFGQGVYYEAPPSLPNRGKSQKITISYDPRSMDRIYLPMPNGEAVTCPLTKASQLYLGRDLRDAEWMFNARLQQDELDKTRQNQSGAFFRAHQNHIIDNAKKAKKLQASGSDLSAAQKVAGIKDNRIEERDHERNDNAFLFGNTPGKKQLPPSSVPSRLNEPDTDYIPAPNYLDMIKNVTKAKKGE